MAFEWLTGNTSSDEIQEVNDRNPVDAVDRTAYQNNIALTNRQKDLKDSQGRWDQTQQSLAQSYQDAISGKGPSVAQAQLGMGQDAAMRQLQSANAGMRGPNAALGKRSMMQAQSNLLGQQNGQLALLRANEVNAARQGLGQVAGQARGQSLEQSQFGYGMDRDAMAMAQAYDQQKRGQQQYQRDQERDRIMGNNRQTADTVKSGIAAGAAGLGKLVVP